MKNLKTSLAAGLAAMALLSLAACSTVTDVQRTPSFATSARWALLPFANDAQAPQANQSAESIAATLLRKRGVTDLTHYPLTVENVGLPEFNDAKRMKRALHWARAGGFQYGLSGDVTEWGYKTGLDGEPAAGVTINVVDIATGQVLWSAAGAETGWGYDSLSGTAQVLLRKLIRGLPLARPSQKKH